jgi:hypothetical protein
MPPKPKSPEIFGHAQAAVFHLSPLNFCYNLFDCYTL